VVEVVVLKVVVVEAEAPVVVEMEVVNFLQVLAVFKRVQ
jgi:hypothetical protein